jgi:hypothetical protein
MGYRRRLALLRSIVDIETGKRSLHLIFPFQLLAPLPQPLRWRVADEKDAIFSARFANHIFVDNGADTFRRLAAVAARSANAVYFLPG